MLSRTIAQQAIQFVCNLFLTAERASMQGDNFCYCKQIAEKPYSETKDDVGIIPVPPRLPASHELIKHDSTERCSSVHPLHCEKNQHHHQLRTCYTPPRSTVGPNVSSSERACSKHPTDWLAASSCKAEAVLRNGRILSSHWLSSQPPSLRLGTCSCVPFSECKMFPHSTQFPSFDCNATQRCCCYCCKTCSSEKIMMDQVNPGTTSAFLSTCSLGIPVSRQTPHLDPTPTK